MHNGVDFGCCESHKWLIKAVQSLCFLNSKKQCPPQVPPTALCPYLRPEISVTRLKQTHPCPQNGAFQKDSDFFKGISLSTSILAVFTATQALISSRVFYHLEGEEHGEQQHRDSQTHAAAPRPHKNTEPLPGARW